MHTPYALLSCLLLKQMFTLHNNYVMI